MTAPVRNIYLSLVDWELRYGIEAIEEALRELKLEMELERRRRLVAALPLTLGDEPE